MTRPGSPEPWVPPWKRDLPQQRCAGPNCTDVPGVGRLVVAATLTDGLCAVCAQTASDEHRKLRLGL